MTRTATKLLRGSMPDVWSECILWQGAQNKYGYGNVRVSVGELLELPRFVGAHRLAYWLWRGPFDLTLQIDHTCHVRTCVNPYHLQPVTISENSSEATTYQWSGEIIGDIPEWEIDHEF